MDWYPFDPTRYRNDTLLLDPYQDGCYRRLIDYYMTSRLPLPLALDAWARIINISIEDWNTKARDVIVPYFQKKRDGYHNKRCDQEILAQDRKSHRRKAKARNAANVRHGKSKEKQDDTKSEHVTVMPEERTREEIPPPPPPVERANFDLMLFVDEACSAAGIRQNVNGTDVTLCMRWSTTYNPEFVLDIIRRRVAECAARGVRAPATLGYYDKGPLADAWAARIQSLQPQPEGTNHDERSSDSRRRAAAQASLAPYAAARDALKRR